jgi:hypothetical protein
MSGINSFNHLLNMVAFETFSKLTLYAVPSFVCVELKSPFNSFIRALICDFFT